MKKAFLTIALAAFAFAANAQLFVGGNLGFGMGNGTLSHSYPTGGGTTTVTYDNAGGMNGFTPNDFNFYIMPKIGYQLNDKMAAGIILGYSSSKTTEVRTTTYDPYFILTTDYKGTEVKNNSTLTFTPFFRYNLMELNAFTLFCEAAIPISISPAEKTVITESGVNVLGQQKEITTTIENNKATSFGLTITPGLNYKFNEHLNMDLYFNAINLGFMVYNNEYSRDNFQNDLWKSSRTEFGLDIHSLPTAAVGFGINYVF